MKQEKLSGTGTMLSESVEPLELVNWFQRQEQAQEEKKKCPFATGQDFCLKEGCALWDSDSGCCCIKSIADEMTQENTQSESQDTESLQLKTATYLKMLLETIEDYGFRDGLGHPLKNCKSWTDLKTIINLRDVRWGQA